MNVLFIMPLALPAYLFQLAALTAFLKFKGHRVYYEELVVDRTIKECHLKRIRKTIEEFKPALLGFSCYEMTFEWVREIADDIKASFADVPIIVGGYYPTLSPEEVIQYPSIDIICLGEGEYALAELLQSMQSGKPRQDIRNLWFKKDGRIIQNPLRPLISNLDELPFVDRDLFTSDNRKNGALEIMASRGCPYNCTNCSNLAFKNLYAGKGAYLRYRSPEHVLDEIEICVRQESFKTVQFEDDLFTANKNWLKDFCKKYERRIRLPFICNIRPESATPETLSVLKNAGCFQVSIGVESGDELIRRKVLGRNMPNQVIIDAFKNTKMTGIKRKSFNMVGIPHETVGSIFKTIWLNFKTAPDAVQTSIYYPFRGTELGDECYARGWVDTKRKKKLKLYANDSILSLPGLPRWFIRIAKWLNSAMVLRSGNLNELRAGIKMIFNQTLKRRKERYELN